MGDIEDNVQGTIRDKNNNKPRDQMNDKIEDKNYNNTGIPNQVQFVAFGQSVLTTCSHAASLKDWKN